MGKRIRDHPQLFHEAANAVEHIVDSLTQPIERVAASRRLDAPSEVTPADAIGHGHDLADTAPNELGEDDAAPESEQDRDDEGDEQRSLQRFAERESVAHGATADQPFATG